jgi:hypothetical protein
MVENHGISQRTEKNRAQNPTVLRIEVQDFDETIKELENRGLTIGGLSVC